MTLLCIDDDPDDFILLQEAVRLACNKCQCVQATDGSNALYLLESVRPDLIFLDNNMPRMNGWETLQHIRQNTVLNQVPVYLLTTHIGNGESEKFLSHGATGCLIKPPSFPDLCTTVQAILDRYIR